MPRTSGPFLISRKCHEFFAAESANRSDRTTEYTEKHGTHGRLGTTEPRTKKIALYYHGIPLYSTAIFESDRYVFNLPLNLRDKVTTGNMYADFRLIRDAEMASGPPMPEALILFDRYD